jgi:hypothetical protein
MGLLIFICSTSAGACPLCDTQNGKTLRAEILNAKSFSNLAEVLLPFVVLFGVAMLYAGWSWLRDPWRLAKDHGENVSL